MKRSYLTHFGILFLLWLLLQPAWGQMLEVSGVRVNVRAGPGTEYDIVATASRGERYPILEEAGNWYKIRLKDGGEGWIYAGLVREVEEPQTPATPPQTPAVAPALSVSPTQLDFGTGPLGTPTSAQTITVSDLGTAELSIQSVTLTGPEAQAFRLQNDTCSGQVLVPGGDCTLAIVFTPQTAEQHRATLRIASDDPESPQFDLPLTGRGGIPAIELLPSAHDFGATGVRTAARQQFTVTSTGNMALRIASLTLTGPDAAHFRLQDDTCSGTQLAPQASCAFEVSFTPLSSGEKQARLLITSNALETPQLEALLRGEGKAPAIVVSPLAIRFAKTEVGSESAPQQVVISNT
ncbi:MAG: SH3 domain-containing protein, partial [Nitrospinota bacterium]